MQFLLGKCVTNKIIGIEEGNGILFSGSAGFFRFQPHTCHWSAFDRREREIPFRQYMDASIQAIRVCGLVSQISIFSDDRFTVSVHSREPRSILSPDYM